MFKKILALVLATMMVLGGMVTVSAAEEAEAPAVEEVTYDYTAAAEDLAALGIFKGKVIDGNTIDFALEDGVTRLQFALFVARIMTGETNDEYWSKVNDNTTPYDDVVNYFGAVSFADENGIIKGKGWIPGIGDNCFDPNGAITFQDAITMAVRALGYKQLQYPNGFLTVGEELGLTADLEPLANEAELTRGQMIQILKNMLYIKVNGAASFAEQNFGLEETVYVIVATELQYLVGADRVYRVDYAGAKANEQTKYVALAPLNADGTYDLENIVHFTEAELGLAQRESETKLGYSYTIRSYSEFADVYDIVANETKTVKNYGDEGKAIKGGSKYNNVTDNIVSIDGTTYKLVKGYTDLYNKSSYANKQPELIVHSMFKGASDITNSYYMYDAAGNILNKDTYKVALLFNGWTQTYYAVVYDNDGNQVGYRQATDADFAACAINTTYSTNQFGVTTAAGDLTTYSFSEITLIDDNNDGKWDRGIYIPYSVAKYSTYTSSNYRYTVANSAKDSSKSTAAAPTLNGAYPKIWNTNKDTGAWALVGGAANGCIRESDIFFAGEGRPAKNDYIVYYFNPYSRTLTVVENLGKAVPGTVTNMKQGSYSYSGSYYYYNGATATIDGNTYVLGYRTAEVYADIYGGNLEKIDANLAKYGYDEDIYAALAGNTYTKLNYVVLAGRLIYTGNAGNACEWIAFDYGAYEKIDGLAYTAYTYNGDIVGVDADGNILVKAYADKTGDQQIVKIGSINGFSYGLLVEDYAALQFQFSGIGTLGLNAMDTMKKAVISDFFKTLTADVDDPQTDDEIERQYMFIVTGISEDGVYEIYTDIDLYWGNAGVSYRQPGFITKQTADITFINGIATTDVCNNSNDTGKDLMLDDESKLVVIGKDGMMTATGALTGTLSLHYVADDPDTKDVNEKSQPVRVYAISADLILVASATVDCEDIWSGDWDTTNTTGGYNYYMVLGDSTWKELNGETNVVAEYDVATGKFVYTYTNLYNIRTGNLETKKVVGGLAAYNSAYTITPGYYYNAPKPIGAIYAEKNDSWTLLTDDIDPIASGSNTCTWANDSEEVLLALLINGLDADADGDIDYAPVFTNSDTAKSGNANAHVLTLSTVKYDPYITFAYDRITYKYDDGEPVSVMLDNNKASTENYTGSIYFNYTYGKSFQGLIVKGTKDLVAPIVPVDPNAPTLDGTKTAAKNALTTLAAGKVDITAYKNAIDAALTIAEVNALKDKYTTLINTALGNIADEEADKALVVDALEALLTETDAAILAGTIEDGSAYTVAQHIQSWIDAQASKTSVELQAALDEANARITALTNAAAAKVTKVASVVNAEGVTTITITNALGTISQVRAYTSADGVSYNTLTRGFALNNDKTVSNSAGQKGEWTATLTEYGTYDVVITVYNVDAFGEKTPALAAGTYKVAVVNGSTLDAASALVVTLG